MNKVCILPLRKKGVKIYGTFTLCHTLGCLFVTTIITIMNNVEKSSDFCQVSDKMGFTFSSNISPFVYLHTYDLV